MNPPAVVVAAAENAIPAVIDSRYRECAHRGSATGRLSAIRVCGLLNQTSNFTFSSHGACFYDDYTKKSEG